MATLQNTLSIWLFWIIIHTQRNWTQNIKKKGYKGHTQTKKKKKKKTRSRKRWLHSKVTCSEVYVHGQWRHAEVKDRPGQTRHQWGQDRKILWQKDLSQTKKDNKLKKLKIWRTPKKKHHRNSINTFKKLPFTTDNYWYLWKLSTADTKLIMDMHILHVDLSFFNVSCKIFLELSG